MPISREHPSLTNSKSMSQKLKGREVFLLTAYIIDSKHKEIFLLVGNILNDGSTVYWLCPLTSLALSSPLLHGM